MNDQFNVHVCHIIIAFNSDIEEYINAFMLHVGLPAFKGFNFQILL